MRYTNRARLTAAALSLVLAGGCAGSDGAGQRTVTPVSGTTEGALNASGASDADLGVDLGHYRYERAQLLELIEESSEPLQRAALMLELADVTRDAVDRVVAQLTELDSRCGDVGCGVGERARRERLEHLEQTLEDEEVKLLGQVVRDHPEFARADEVLYRLGCALLDDERPEVALRHMRELIARYPSSEYVPHAFLAFGDHFFAEEDIDKAIQLYQKVLAFGESRSTPFAHFKLGWCWINKGEFAKALGAFVKAVQTADLTDYEASGRLREEAVKDLVRAYAQVGQPAKAPDFFERVAPGRVDFMLGLLAERLFDEGKYQESIQVNRQLTARVECSTIQARAQLGVYEAFLLLGERDKMLVEARRLSELFVQLGRCLPPEELVGFVELGNEARENLKSQAARFRAEFEETMEPAAAVMADELEAAAAAF